ncbi:hypothetical protein JCM10213_002218 [Rhodosporidiobolus nylandii]
MDGDTSGYVPLSLTDTLTSTRTYRSAKAASSTSSRPAPRPSVAGSYNAKERQDAARRQAAEMMSALGMSSAPSSAQLDVEATPRPDRSLNTAAAGAGRATGAMVDETPRPDRQYGAAGGAGRAAAGASEGTGAAALEAVSLRTRLADKDEELAALRREVGVLQREKKDLSLKVDRLEREKRETGGTAGLDVRQLEELERQFEAQEKLLAGYQREAERSATELDGLRGRQRRYAEWFERTYGPDWQDDLGLTDKPHSSSSPIVRTKLAARASLAGGGGGLGTPTAGHPLLQRLNTDSSSSSIFSAPTDESHSLLDELSSPSRSPSPAATAVSAPAPPATIDPAANAALKQHLDAVQALLRSMEARLIARDVELAEVEKRAREEKELARGKQGELEEVVEKLREELRAA